MQQHYDDQAVAEESSGEEPSSFVGQELRAAREALKLPIKQLADDLRIDPHYLVALEENDFAAFSAPVFAMGFLKQYAIRLGLDEKELLADYSLQVGALEPPSLRSPTLRSLRYRSSTDQNQARRLVAGSAIVSVVAASLIWYFSGSEPAAPVVRQPDASIPVGEPGAPVTETAESGEAAMVQPVPEVESLPLGLEQPVPQQRLEGPGEELVEEPVEAPAGVAERTLQVEIIFYEDCWTEIIDGRGERLFYGLGSVGARAQFTATPPLSFLLGNAGGIVLLVDDMPYAIPAESRRGNIAEFVIRESAD